MNRRSNVDTNTDITYIHTSSQHDYYSPLYDKEDEPFYRKNIPTNHSITTLYRMFCGTGGVKRCAVLYCL